MIASIRHKGLKRLYDTGDGRELRQVQVKRIRRVLAILDSASRIEDVDQLPGMRLHPLKGDLTGFWSVFGVRQLARDLPVRGRRGQ